ncbi:MAG: DUF4157 domain-containing protein [Calothrix sp. FI2-JRJ7]|jgi:hypothetical protein|nr:DUF4157 domain-containing protein [Calothrix sp. FI2-JRJ7]
MRERVGKGKKDTANSFSISTQLQPTRGFGLESPHVMPKETTSQQAVQKPPSYDFNRILMRPQAKLTVNKPGDVYEQEADRVAQQVMQPMSNPAGQQQLQQQSAPQEEEQLQTKPLANSITPVVQREAMPDEEQEIQTKPLVNSITPVVQREAMPDEEQEIQTKPLVNSITPVVQREAMPDEEQEIQTKPLVNSITPVVQREAMPEEEEQVQMKSMVQRKSAEAGMAPTSDVESSIKGARGSGQPMADDIRQPMEQAFGANFSGVKIHTDSRSHELNQAVQARAFTTGSDIFFRQGEYSPGSNGGKELLAHELTHVVQQSGGAVQRKLISNLATKENKVQAKAVSSKSFENRQTTKSREKSKPVSTPTQGFSLETNTTDRESSNFQENQPANEQLSELDIRQQQPLSHNINRISLRPQAKLTTNQAGNPDEQQAALLQRVMRVAAPEPMSGSNKELRLQPQKEQEEQPLQAKQLDAFTTEFSLNKELQKQPLKTANPIIQAKVLEGGFTPSPISIQRGVGDWLSKGWNKTKDVVGAGIERGRNFASGVRDKGKDLLKSGLNWVRNNVIQPLMRLGSSGWSAVKNFGSRIATAYKQANPTIWDVFLPQHLMFRMARDRRRQLFAQAIQAEKNQQAKAAGGIQSSGPAPVQEPSQLERLNDLAEKVESVPAAGFNVGKELLEGAVVGDFNENPTIWNTIGQVAIGFVPYAGQAADIRDIIANVKKLHEGGYKDPDAWINLVLTGIGIIPGYGDTIKAVNKGSTGAIRKALSGVLKNADKVLRPALGKAKGMLNAARRYGKQFLGWASRQGGRLRQGVRQFAQKTVNFARAAGKRARGLVTALRSRISGFVTGAMQKARAVASQGRGLMGRALSQFMGMAQNAFNALQNRVSQAVDLVKAAAQRTKDIALKVTRKVADTTRKATTLLREFTQSAIQKGRQAAQKARQWSSQQVKKATDLGRRLVKKARDRVTNLVRQGVKLAKDKALAWIKQKIGGIKQRLLGFLQDRWNRLKDKLGIGKRGKPGKEGAEHAGKETTDHAAKKAAELPAAIAEAKAITEANDRLNTPIPILLAQLRSLKGKYLWIRDFQEHQKGVPGHYSIWMIASKTKISNYTTAEARKDDVAHGGWYGRKEIRKMIHEANYSDHGKKHLKAITEDEARTLSYKEAQYLPGVKNWVLEKTALFQGVLIPRPNGAFWKIYRFDNYVGFDQGKKTCWIRAEYSSGTYHGHPMSIERVRKYIKNAQE